MVTFVDRIEQAAAYGALYTIDTSIAAGAEIKRALLPVGEGCSRAMHDIYSLDGFEKWTKAVIADLRFISLIPNVRGVFDDCIKTLEAQKDLYYATLFIHCTAEDFIDKENMRFKIPKLADGSIDKVKVLYGIGHYFEVLKFLQKYQVFSFSTATHLANKYGAIKVYRWRLDEVPVVMSLFDKPKDVCIFVASLIGNWLEFKKCRAAGTVSFDNMVKFTGCTGKMILITFGKNYYHTWWFAVVDVLTQNASLIALIRKRSVERQRRFDHP